MPLTLNCPKCRNPFRVRDEALGQKVKCPSCTAILAVPANIAPASIVDIPVDLDAPRPMGIAPPPPPVPLRPMPESMSMRTDQFESIEFDAPESIRNIEDILASPSKYRLAQAASRPERTVAMPDKSEPGVASRLAAKPKGRRLGDKGTDGVWRSMAGNLRMIQVATWLAFVPALCELGKAIYFLTAKAGAEPMKSLFHVAPFWQEVTFLYLAVPLLLSFLLVLMARVSLMKVPPETEARGLAVGSMFMTLLSFIGLAVSIALISLAAMGTINASARWVQETQKGAAIAFLFFGFISEVWFLLMLGQLGHPIGEPRLQLGIGRFALMACIVVGVPVAVNEFYPLFVSSTTAATADAYRLNQVVSWSAIAAVSFTICLIYVLLVGKARRTIRGLAGDR